MSDAKDKYKEKKLLGLARVTGTQASMTVESDQFDPDFGTPTDPFIWTMPLDDWRIEYDAAVLGLATAQAKVDNLDAIVKDGEKLPLE